jgi:hypothetical protein
MIYIDTFTIDFSYTQSIKQLTDNLSIYGLVSCLYIWLYAQFEIL